MTDTALENAQNRRDSIAAEINSLAQRVEELKRELAKIDAWIAQWHEFADAHQAIAAAKQDTQDTPNKVKYQVGETVKFAQLPKIRRASRATGNPKKEDVAEAARQIIQERGEPVSRAELFRALADRGVAISSEHDPEMVLSTMLWRMRDKVVRLKTGGYWLAERPLPQDGYEQLQ